MSREINLLIAKHIFDNDTRSHFVDEDGCRHIRLPQYCTKIEDAWKGVDEIAKDLEFKGVGLHTNIDCLSNSYCVVVTDFDEKELGKAVEETAPMAICLAILRAKGIEIKI